jgi:uncharacterized protein involved in exopolysaccharide biosynthesis
MDAKTRNTTVATDSQEQPLSESGVLDLGAVTRIAMREKLTVLTIIAIFLAVSVLYLHVAKKKYSVKMVVTSVNMHGQSAGGGALDELSSMAGLDLNSTETPQFKLFVGALRSPYAAEAIAADQDLLKAMFPLEWSAKEGRWRQPPSLLRSLAHAVASVIGWYFPPWTPPDATRVFEYLSDELKVVPDTKSGTVTLEIDSNKPAVAERVLVTMNNALDERMRQRDLTRSTIDIGYLTDRLSQVTVEDYRKALVSNLVQQEKERMLASAPLPYISDTLGKTIISSRPVSPVPLAVLAAALVLGGLVGVMVAVNRHRRR